MTGNHKYMTGIYQKAEGFNKTERLSNQLFGIS
jgi:hypothetical protein